MRYIGESKKSMKFRFSQHKSYVNITPTVKKIGFHFNLPGHQLANMRIKILEQIQKKMI